MGFQTLVPLWAKCAPVVVLGLGAYALLQAAEFSRQSYELSVCTSNTTKVNVCQFDSAPNNAVALGSTAAASIGLAALAANALAPPAFPRLRAAFVPLHSSLVAVWYFFSWALTLVPLVYTSYLMAEQAASMRSSLSASPAAASAYTYGESDLLVSLGGDAPYNPCNPGNVYCSPITPGLLAGFGYLCAGATAFWCAWLVMDDTARVVLQGGDFEDALEGAYVAAKAAPPAEALVEPAHMAQVR